MKDVAFRSMVLVAAVLFAAGVVSASRTVLDRLSAGALGIEPSVLSAGELKVDEEQLVRFRFANAGSTPIYFLGATSYCAEDFCVRVVDLPEALAPHDAITLEVEVKPRKPGDFRAEFTVFTDDAKRPKRDLAILGRGVN
jgi:hypothetical protein